MANRQFSSVVIDEWESGMEFVSVEKFQKDLTDYNTKFASCVYEASKLTEQIIEKLTNSK